MADLIIRNGLVVTMDPDRRVIEDGAVAIAAGRIVAVGDTAAIAARHSAPRTIAAHGHAVLPGFIDVHAHAGHGLVKTIGGGDSAKWTEAVETIYPRATTPAFWGAEAALSATERLMGGVTTGVSIFGAYGSRTDEPAYAEAHIAAYARVGIRNVLAVGTNPRPHPSLFVRWRGERAEEVRVPFQRQLEVAVDLADRFHGAQDGLTRIMLTAPLWYPGRPGEEPRQVAAALEDARAVKAAARARGLGFTQDGHRTGTVRAVHEAGLLGPDTLLSHCIDIEPDEIALIAETDTKVAHNPSAVFSIRGRCPAIELMDAGATVAIASDGTAPDRSYDMFRHMWQAMHYHRRHFRDAGVLPPGKALEMVTCDAARALGMDAEIGSLEPGKRADVILVDLRKPHLYPPHMPLYRLVCFAAAADVATVIVGGRVLMDTRRVLTVEVEAVLEEARIEAERAIARAGLAHLLGTPPGFWKATRYAG